MKKGDSGKKFLLCFTTGVLAGILLGTAALSTLISYRVDSYYLEVKKLEAIIEEKDVRLKKLDEKLEESVNKNKMLLKDIQVILSFSDDEEVDEMVAVSLEKNIKEKYTHLLGQEVKSIDINMAAEVIDKRIFIIDGKEFRLKMTKATLSEVLTLWVDIIT